MSLRLVKLAAKVNNGSRMKAKTLICLLVTLGGLCSPRPVAAKDNKPTGWAYAAREATDVEPSPSTHRRPIAHLGRGALVTLYETLSKGGVNWSRVRVVDLGTLEPRAGWVEASQLDGLPIDRFPPDAYLLDQLGGVYLDDSLKSQVQVARFLVRQGTAEPALVCFLGSTTLPQTRLQIFRRAQAKFMPGAFLELPFSEIKSGVAALEVRDLLGDGNECLVTREPFQVAPEQRGVNLVIRRIGQDSFEKLWEAPLEFRNLTSFPAKYRVLQPPEMNIGVAGTLTKATVEFRSRGRLSEPVWKGKVGFHVPGRAEPVESVAVEKTCAWDGARFQALK